MSSPPRAVIPQLSELDLVIDTARLRLRPFELSDVEDLFPVVSRPEFPVHMSGGAHASRDDTAAFIRHSGAEIAANTGVALAIEHAGRVIGTIGLHGVTWQRAALRVDTGELGYWIAPDAWGKGYCTEAAGAMVRFGFDTLGLHKVTTRCFAENAASRRVIEKVGFRFVGRAEEDVWRDGHWHAHLLFELTAPEWPDLSATTRVIRRP
jgi:ribosomal-protein-alanine N-acetyltransferase